MQKKILMLITLLLLNLTGYKVMAQANSSEKSVIIANNSVVPKNKTYYLYDSTGTRLLRVYKPGQRIMLPNRFPCKLRSDGGRGTKGCDCEPVLCPDASTGCWKCCN